MGQLVKGGRTEVTDKLRREINKVVDKYIEQGVAELVPGVLFIDEVSRGSSSLKCRCQKDGLMHNTDAQVHMLDMECFTFLNRALESPLSPYVVLASNRGITTIRGTDSPYDLTGILSPHGLPIDLLDRCMIVKTATYTRDEVRTVLETRARVEGIILKREALERLADTGEKSSLRFSLQLLTPASILAKMAGRVEVGLEDVGELGELFLDGRRSGAVVMA